MFQWWAHSERDDISAAGEEMEMPDLGGWGGGGDVAFQWLGERCSYGISVTGK